MPIEIGRKLPPDDEASMLAEAAILRDVTMRMLEILAGEEQPDDAAPTEESDSTGDASQ